MDKYKIDLEGVVNRVNAPKIYKLADVQSRIQRLGCGVVRFVDENNKVGLWKIMEDEDGSEYIGAMYEDNYKDVVKNSWTMESDKLKKTATIFYKNTPITNIVFAEIGIPEKEVDSFLRHLPERLAENKQVVQKMLNSIDKDYKASLVKQFPEILK